MRSSTLRIVSGVVGVLAAVSLLAGGHGCSKEPAAPQQVVKKQAPKPESKPPASPAAEMPAKKGETAVLYDSSGKRDPFVSFIKKEDRRKAAVDATAPPLERYELGELKFVGVLWTRKGARALVEDAEGKGYSVTVGMRIGRAGGVVSRITDKEILVKEEFFDTRGEKIVRESGIQLTTAGGK